MKKGLNLWTVIGFAYTGTPTVEEVLRRAREYGYDGVEIVYDDGLLDPARLDGAWRRRIVELADSLGLEIPSVATGVFWKYNMGLPEGSKEREMGLRYGEAGLQLAHDLGAEVLLVVPAVAVPGVPYEEILGNASAALKRLAGKAEDLGVTIGVENVWNKLLYSPLEYKGFIEGVGSDAVKAYFDVGNVVALGLHDHWIPLLKGLLAMVHVKDFDESVGGLRGFRHVGMGGIDWPHVLELLRGAGYDGFLNVECPPEFYGEREPRYPEDGFRAARDNAEALKRLIG